MIQGISTALTALYASQKALDTTGNNIANANTEGYTRQRVDLSPIGSASLSFWGKTISAGAGVEIDQISRIRDEYLEQQSLTEGGKQGLADRVANTMSSIEDAFGEPGENGIQSQMAEFFKAWGTAATTPGGKASVVQSGLTVAAGFQRVSTALDTISTNALSSLKNDVEQINSIAVNIADLNKSIATLGASTGDVNNLQDQRDQLIRKLSVLSDVQTTVEDNGAMTVALGGTSLVRGDRVHRLDVDDTGNPVQLRWDNGDNLISTGNLAGITSGNVGGLLNTINVIVPRYRASIDTAASSLMNAVNSLHTTGEDANGVAGLPFFTGTSARTLDVNATLVSNPERLAVAKGGSGASADLSNAEVIAKLTESTSGPDKAYRDIIGGLGVESQRATRQADIQTQITKSANDSRVSVSGVNLDEEMTNLIAYQHSYNAAAKYLAAMDEVLQSLLNIIR